jgi:hypothetical protein
MKEGHISNAAQNNKRMPRIYFVIATALALLALQKAAPAQTKISAKTPITLPNGGQFTHFDISWADPLSRVFLLADGGNAQVEIVDLNTNTVTSTVGGFKNTTDPNMMGPPCLICGPNGVATVNHIEAWAGDGPSFSGPVVLNANPTVAYAADNCDSSVQVINLVTKKITDTINVGGCFRSDEVAFDPVDQVFVVANPGELDIAKASKVPFIALISTQPVLPGQHHQILKKINFDGTNGTPNATCGANCTIEQTTYSPDTGLFYVITSNCVTGTCMGTSLPNDVVAVIDPRGGATCGSPSGCDADDIAVVNLYNVPNCGGGTGTALKKYTLFIGCGNASQFMDIRNGTILATVPQVAGVDEVWYDAGNDLFLAAAFPPVNTFYTIDGTTLQLSQSIPINGIQGAVHSVASDPVTKQIFLPVPAGGAPCGASPNNGCIAVFGP